MNPIHLWVVGLAIVMTLAHAFAPNRVPLWVAVLLLCLAGLLPGRVT